MNDKKKQNVKPLLSRTDKYDLLFFFSMNSNELLFFSELPSAN